MGKQPFISHVVNGYSRYDVPESKAFTCTPGILYPVRIDFINARDRVTIDQGIDVRSNPLAVPTFNPYTVRLHRFWVPMQLYHPEMRTNSSKFDMNNISLNWVPNFMAATNQSVLGTTVGYSNSLLAWLRLSNRTIKVSADLSTPSDYYGVSLPTPSETNSFYNGVWSNCDTYLAYWDIVRNYYSYSQWGVYSYAWPASWKMTTGTTANTYVMSYPSSDECYFTQCYGNLEYLDAFFESQFYPSAVVTSNNTYNRGNLFYQILNSDLYGNLDTAGVVGDGYPVSSIYPGGSGTGVSTGAPDSQFAVDGTDNQAPGLAFFSAAHPMAVIPSSPDRFSRLLPTGSGSSVSMTGVTTIPQLAVASRLQEYKDLLGAGGSRFSDWLETFFASKIEHVDRPKLLFSASQTVNAQVVMNQSGQNMFGNTTPLGSQGGSIAFNSRLGRSQSYYFREPGYMIDMLSIRPVYYWAGVRPDYLDYQGSDYFNPIYNDIGYQSLSQSRFGVINAQSAVSVANEPCFNEFRSSYDEVLGQLSALSGDTHTSLGDSLPLYSYWVQQRSLFSYYSQTAQFTKNIVKLLFVDLATVNSPFASNVEDNFFVNLSYSVRKKNLVNKTFATRLSNR